MSGDAAASTLAEIKLKQLEREGKKSTKTKRELVESSAPPTTPNRSNYAAARLWVDAIIDPLTPATL